MLNDQLLILTLLCPFFGAILNGLVSLKTPQLSLRITLGSLLLALTAAVFLAMEVLGSGVDRITYSLGGWSAPYGIEFVANTFNSVLVIFILIVALFNLLHASPLLGKLYPRGRQFYSLYLLLVTSFIGLCFTGDIFNIYVFLEISSLTSYALIGRGDGRACRAAFNYLIVGTVGASFILIGIGFLYIKTGTLNIAQLHELMPALHGSQSVRTGYIFILLGLMIKMAVFPLHIWLPNAYCYCPQASAGLLAPVATKVSLFLLFKFSYDLFASEYLLKYAVLQNFIVNLMAFAILFLCLLALAQKNWVRAFCYFVVVEICYIFGGFWLHNEAGLTGAAFHIFTDMMLTLGIFMFIGAIRINYGAFTAENLSQLFRRFPLITFAFLIYALTLIGVPPTAGFISKFYLIQGAVDQQQWFFVFALLFASLTAVIIIFRIIEQGFFNENIVTQKPFFPHKSRLMMSTTMCAVAFILLALGLFSQQFIEATILPFLRAT